MSKAYTAHAVSFLSFVSLDGTTAERFVDHHVDLEVGHVVVRHTREGDAEYVVDDVSLAMVEVEPDGATASRLEQRILLREVDDDPPESVDPVDNHPTVTPTE